jgi:hypothetical protein
MITDHAFIDLKGPDYLWGPCGKRYRRGMCGKKWYNHTTHRVRRGLKTAVWPVHPGLQREPE